MPRLSVVVPVYNVEEYLEQCLDSVLAQTFTDYEVVMVDDGSTDSSAEIAGRYVNRDERFRLISQENGGLSKARNTGTAAARGELLAFLDSDDALLPHAYELLVGALDRTGSDFATGNVHRLTRFTTSQSPFLARAFSETRMKTHITKFRPLLADRTAWNKVWRRSFWDQHGFRFPEGRTYEDIPVTIPAHFTARSVDVIAEPVYLYRIRETGKSITQRRVEPQALIDRLTSIQEVSDHLAHDAPRGAKRWYDESVVADDLRYYVNALDSADDDYRALFLDRVNAFLDGTSDRIFKSLPAIERLKWHLIRRRLMDDLLVVLRFQKEELYRTPPLRIRGRWYGDYPFRTDTRLKIPRSIYRLTHEFAMGAGLQELAVEDGKIRIRGHAYINGIGADSENAQRVTVSLLRPGRLTRVRLITSAVRLRARSTHRPEITGNVRGALSDLSWSGFEATLDPRRLHREGNWQVYVTVRAAGIKRRRSRFYLEPGRPLRPVSLRARGRTLTVAVNHDAELDVALCRRPAAVRDARLLDSGQVELAIAGPGDDAVFELREMRGRMFKVPVKNGRVRVLAERLRTDEDSVWDLAVVTGGRRLPVALDEPRSWIADGREVAIVRGGHGAALAERAPRAVIDDVRWADGGELAVAGAAPAAARVSLGRGADNGFSYDFPAEHEGGRFTARLTPTRIPSLAGALPINEGTWELRVDGVPAALAEPLQEAVPLPTVVGHRLLEVGMTPDGRAVLEARRDLEDDERGLYNQQRLQRTAYGALRDAPLRDAVVYSSFLGRQYSDSPRAIHEELVRRDAPLEHLWVVRDGRCAVPDTATVLREGSREYHEALARARYVVTNDHFPEWFERREDQLCLQTWHGTPFKRLGFDVSDLRKQRRKFERSWDRQVRNWQYVLSPNRFSTPILRRAYLVEGEMLETGYPRVDVLARPDRDALSREIRSRLGIPEGKRTVLYAPTFRDHVQDRRKRYRLELALDLDRLRNAVGEDTVILFRKHHYIVDPAPETADGFVRDVSAYPDGTELMLAADVLLTDYSSMMVDYANTGRPMLFFTYDLDLYEDEIRGFYLDDFVGTVPGPLLHTTDDVAEALHGLDGVRAEYAERYAAFRETFCELDDGHAAARVVDRLF
ncbi:MAG TPA: CDP-glycerol glycerophosphotransferase family protein [Solirubrobacteraceae bacterium]